MRIKPRLLKRWQFSASVLAPAVVLLTITAGVVVGFVLWSTADVDRRSLERQTELVRNIVADEVAKVPRAQESIAIWDDAIEHTRRGLDKDWVDNNLGIWMYEYYGYDHVVLFDQADQPIYTMSGGVAPAPALFVSEKSMLMKEVAALRALLGAGALQARPLSSRKLWTCVRSMAGRLSSASSRSSPTPERSCRSRAANTCI